MTSTHVRRAATTSLGVPTWGVAGCSLLSMALAVAKFSAIPQSVSVRLGQDAPLTGFLPHLIAFTGAVSGFPALAALFAIIGALPWLFMGGIAIIFGAGTDIWLVWFILLQIGLTIFALCDVVAGLRGNSPRLRGAERILGLICGGAVCLGINTLLQRENARPAPSRAERETAQRRDSLRLVAQHARELASPAWKSRSSLQQLHDVAHCIDVYHRATLVHRPFPRTFAELVRWGTSGEQLTFQAECWRVLRDADTLHSPPLLDPHHIVHYEPSRSLADTLFARGMLLEIEARWDSTDTPVSATDPGARSYLLDRRGRVHVSPTGRRATVADPILPICQPNELASRDGCWPATEF